jgi:hypothetical protein
MPLISKLTRAAVLTAAAVGYVSAVYSAPASCQATCTRQRAGGVGDLIGRRPAATTAVVAAPNPDGCTLLPGLSRIHSP